MERMYYIRYCKYNICSFVYEIEKKEQDNLTDDEKNVLKKLVKSLKEEASKNRR